MLSWSMTIKIMISASLNHFSPQFSLIPIFVSYIFFASSELILSFLFVVVVLILIVIVFV